MRFNVIYNFIHTVQPVIVPDICKTLCRNIKMYLITSDIVSKLFDS